LYKLKQHKAGTEIQTIVRTEISIQENDFRFEQRICRVGVGGVRVFYLRIALRVLGTNRPHERGDVRELLEMKNGLSFAHF
jgi:hypothetical protein